jgi:hypothetical protein
MKKFNLIALMAVIALITTGAYAREASFGEMLGGDSVSIVRGLNADAQKISFPVPAGMESCKYASVQGDTCSFTCKSGATVTRPRLNSSVAQNGGCALFVMVPVQKAAPAPRVYAEGHLYAYNRATKKYDTDMFLRCSVTLNNFKSYLDTQHGSPRDVVSADYRLGGFPDLGSYAAGNSVASAPDKYSDYVNLQGYVQTGLTKGVDVNIFIDKVASAQAFVAGPPAPLDVYVTMEKSMTSYFGGDGVKWGYWCDFRAK